jgi:hypothetical protein
MRVEIKSPDGSSSIFESMSKGEEWLRGKGLKVDLSNRLKGVPFGHWIDIGRCHSCRKLERAATVRWQLSGPNAKPLYRCENQRELAKVIGLGQQTISRLAGTGKGFTHDGVPGCVIERVEDPLGQT